MCDNVSPDLTVYVELVLGTGVVGFGFVGAGVEVTALTFNFCPTKIKSDFKLFKLFNSETVMLYALAI